MIRRHPALPFVALVVSLALWLLFPLTGQAQRVTHPTAQFPTGASVQRVAPLSNTAMDCAWGFACQEGVPDTHRPAFHLRTQTDLHRLDGWEQTTSTPHLAIALFVSRYEQTPPEQVMPWSVQAFSDLGAIMLLYGFRDLNGLLRLQPAGVVGNTMAERRVFGKDEVLIVACWAGDVEAEAVGIYPKGSSERRRAALGYLAAQIRQALSEPG